MAPPEAAAGQDEPPQAPPAASAGQGQGHTASAGHRDHRHWGEKSLGYGACGFRTPIHFLFKMPFLSIPQQPALPAKEMFRVEQ